MEPIKDLLASQKKLDEIDRRIIADLAERKKVLEAIGPFLHDVTKEEEQLAAVLEQSRHLGLDPYSVSRVFREILGHPARLQREDPRPALPLRAAERKAAPESADRSNVPAIELERLVEFERAAENLRLAILDKKPYRLASRAYKPEDTVIKIGGALLGGRNISVIGGPCSVESKEQIFACARKVWELGGDFLRGGCFKPRTSPYSFQGLGFKGLELLAEAGRKYGLPTVTEVMDTTDVAPMAEVADVLQIGARNVQNFSLLKAVGKVNRPILLKRGMMTSIDEYLAAAEYILSEGNQQVILCERGIRTFETATRNTLDLSAIPVLAERTHLPVIVDPSHACGVARWVTPLAEAALACGSHGIMIEIHPQPEKALCDGAQALNFEEFSTLMRRIGRGYDNSAKRGEVVAAK